MTDPSLCEKQKKNIPRFPLGCVNTCKQHFPECGYSPSSLLASCRQASFQCHKQNTNRCEWTSEYQEGSHHSNNNHGKSYKHPPLHQHLLKIQSIWLTEIQRGKNKKAREPECSGRNELKVEKLELLPQVALLCPCPRLAQGRIMKEIFSVPPLPPAYRVQSLVWYLKVSAAYTIFFWIIYYLSSWYSCLKQCYSFSSGYKHVFIKLSHCIGYSPFVKVQFFSNFPIKIQDSWS